MDRNKDEALKCLRIGIKFLIEARRLDPSIPIDDLLLSSVENPNPNSWKRYTEEQLTAVKKIKSHKDYYRILDLDRSCSAEDIQNAYRKLSLLAHPDKNKAPGAKEAFKAVSKAFRCLGDEESRKRYDLVGSEDPNDDDELYPDKIYRNFFYSGTFHLKKDDVQNDKGVLNGSGGFWFLIQILPLLFFLLLFSVYFLVSMDPVYVLSKSQGYEHKLETERGVAYFVKSVEGFSEEYPILSNERFALEGRVERDYIDLMKQNCRLDLQRSQWGFVSNMTHCDVLFEFVPQLTGAIRL